MALASSVHNTSAHGSQMSQSQVQPSKHFDEDWEEWSPEKGSFIHHMIAGSAAGVAEHVSIYPIDTIKTHMQCQQCYYGERVKFSAFQTFRRLMLEEGPLRLFRGVSTMLGASLPAHALYFSVFEAAKSLFGANHNEPTLIASGAAGLCGTVCHDLIMTPMDVVKQRLQLGYYRGTISCLRSIARTEGLQALYISFPTTLLMNLPYSMIMVSANETFKKLLNPSGDLNVTVYISSGAAAGALAAAITNPLDVAKTRLQTQTMYDNDKPVCHTSSPCSHARHTPYNTVTHKIKSLDSMPKLRKQYRGLLDALIQIRAQEGFSGYFRGVCPRLLVHAPSVAISWTTFEVLKKALGQSES